MSIPLLCAWCWLHLASVLVCSSCYNTTDWVEVVRRYGIRWRPASWLTDSCVFLLHPHMAEGLRELAGVFVMRAPIPFMWDSFNPIHPHDLITSQRPHHFGELGFNIWILVRGRHKYSIDGNLSHCLVYMFCLSLLNDKILEGLNYVFFIHYLPYSISKQCLSLLCPHTFIFVDLMLGTLPLTKKWIHCYSEIFLSSDSSFSSLAKLPWELTELASLPLWVKEVWKSVSWVNWGSPRWLLFHITSSPRKTSLGSTFFSNHISLENPIQRVLASYVVSTLFLRDRDAM